MFLTLFLNGLECLIISYFLSLFVEKKRDDFYIIISTLFGFLTLFVCHNFYIKYIYLFCFNLIFLIFYRKNKNIESVMYCLIFVLFLFLCDVYTNTLYDQVKNQTSSLMLLFSFLSKLLFFVFCILLNEFLNSDRSKYTLFREALLILILSFSVFVIYKLIKIKLSKELLLIMLIYTIIVFLVFLYAFILKRDEDSRYLDLMKMRYNSQQKNDLTLKRLHQEVITKEHHMTYILKKIHFLSHEKEVNDYVKQELDKILQSQFILKTGNDLFDESITDVINNFKKQKYDIKVICSIGAENILDNLQTINDIKDFINEIISISDKSVTIYIIKKNNCLIIKIVSVFKEKNNTYIFSHENGLESYNMIID